VANGSFAASLLKLGDILGDELSDHPIQVGRDPLEGWAKV
jgi:hypothetical protein